MWGHVGSCGVLRGRGVMLGPAGSCRVVILDVRKLFLMYLTRAVQDSNRYTKACMSPEFEKVHPVETYSSHKFCKLYAAGTVCPWPGKRV